MDALGLDDSSNADALFLPLLPLWPPTDLPQDGIRRHGALAHPDLPFFGRRQVAALLACIATTAMQGRARGRSRIAPQDGAWPQGGGLEQMMLLLAALLIASLRFKRDPHIPILGRARPALTTTTSRIAAHQQRFHHLVLLPTPEGGSPSICRALLPTPHRLFRLLLFRLLCCCISPRPACDAPPAACHRLWQSSTIMW